MGESRTEGLLLLLTGIVFLLMVAIIGLFLRMNQLQREVLAALEPLRPAPHLSGLSPGTEAPAFTLPDLSGQSISLETLAGRRVLLAFASPRCPACREMYPHLRAFAEAHPEVAVVMISLGTYDACNCFRQEGEWCRVYLRTLMYSRVRKGNWLKLNNMAGLWQNWYTHFVRGD